MRYLMFGVFVSFLEWEYFTLELKNENQILNEYKKA